MRIADSAIQFSATHQLVMLQARRESVRAWIGAERPAEGQPTPAGTTAIAYDRESTRSLVDGDQVSVGASGPMDDDGEGMSPGNLAALLGPRMAGLALRPIRPHGQERAPAEWSARPRGFSCLRDEASALEEEAGLDAKSAMLKILLERLYGIHVRLTPAADVDPTRERQETAARSANGAAASQREGWGVEVTVEERQAESETTTFIAVGIVKTADGKEISFTLSLTMHREYEQESQTVLKAGDAAIDPLVINFDGTAAELSDATFQFDLQGDGQAETIHTLGQGSGFLALDRNGDGRITDGTELFGPRSGDGFSELAQYDADGNQWIDEGDPVYADLRLWQPDPGGDGALTTLSEKDVGAIYLGRAQTPFAVKDARNEEQGQIVASGVYLSETGTVGSVQQVNLTV